EYADPKKITLYLNATVHQILFDKGQPRPRAEGVEFKDTEGKMHRAYLNKGFSSEIVLTAGALGSPQLLMLSGIGPKDHLWAHKIEVVVDQPMVGQGMSDNPMNGLVIPSPQPVEVSLIQVVGITRFDSYIEAASGSQFGYVGSNRLTGFFERLANQTDQQIQAELPSEINPFVNPAAQAGIILEKIMGPLSTGHLELVTKDPNDNPRVTFNYFKDPRDLDRCVQGMNTIVQVIQSRSFSRFRYPGLSVQALINAMVALPVNTRPRHFNTAVSMEQFCIDTVMTIWHYHGGCQVGKVVDRDYRVIGVDALRVVDGSTFYDSPGTNPQATVMMLGR
ncbi:(R)-mandelonitrile oxidase, partial [Sarracenia purpurea var. burkii]